MTRDARTVAPLDDFDERKARTDTVIRWIVENKGERVASAWAWECTPIPCGLPSDEQLEEGLRIATGELDVGEVMARVEAEMYRLARERT